MTLGVQPAGKAFLSLYFNFFKGVDSLGRAHFSCRVHSRSCSHHFPLRRVARRRVNCVSPDVFEGELGQEWLVPRFLVFLLHLAHRTSSAFQITAAPKPAFGTTACPFSTGVDFPMHKPAALTTLWPLNSFVSTVPRRNGQLPLERSFRSFATAAWGALQVISRPPGERTRAWRLDWGAVRWASSQLQGLYL